MKKAIIITAMLAGIVLPLFAANVEMKYSGPSGQGNLIFVAPSTGTTNLEMTTTGLKNITLQGGALIATPTVTRQANPSMTAATATGANVLAAPTITVTAQRPGAQTPTITVTPQAPATVTPTITVTKETGAVTASGANNLVTPTATITPQAPGAVTPTITVTAQAPGAQTPTITVTLTTAVGYDSTGAAITNAAGESLAFVTGVTATCSALLDYATNATATCSALPNFITNATCAITPDLASNAVVTVSVTGGGAVVTNATAASSALPDFITNATAACSALLDYPTNATASCSAVATNGVVAVTVTPTVEAVNAVTNVTIAVTSP
ncbi:MAG: hypothetical protein WC455_19435 [Dehalococcoidia bacterium]|jgi:hypothetical protein